ncbi:S8 family serine peptidase [Streptomyces sp. PT12]|uniref:S8 family serine peptidase n=1 Tax=Streptomyces sp. PT12 TaxID=1510197 RepID=UPI000DE34475|nr:S8 family serine peptidase [Streptomyces sp. PT12]RBM18072.1 serine protease [Streptomyces sp. PT12]
MSLRPRSHSLPPGIPPAGRRRPHRTVLTAALAVTLGFAGVTPALADDSATAPAPLADKPIGEKFSTQDATLLAEAKAAGDDFVTLLIAAEPGETEQVAERLDAVSGASVGFTEESIGYVRVTVTTGKADAAIEEATGLDDVLAIDLNDTVQAPDPSPGAGEQVAEASAARRYQGPNEDTPAENPYQPAHETGAVDFVDDHPRWDGRGVTIGVLDLGVDLAHPALQETTTGERKIVDSVTATDPIIDGDLSWRAMTTAVSGPSFTFNNTEYTAPEGDFLVNVFRESVAVGEIGGDVNRDGDTTDVFGVLYDPEAGAVRVDIDADGDFTDESWMTPYNQDFQVGYFGTDDEDTEVAESLPFVVEIREDVPMDPYGGDWVGEVRDFVNIGIVSGNHGTHVAGIAAANGLFGGEMNGAAPGAQIVSSRACVFGGGCTYTALFEGMIDLVVNRDVDLVNVSIGGLPALNDGNNARAHLYTELIDTYDVELFISAGNDGPGVNTIGDPSVAEKVVSVGAAISRETWAANYGSGVDVSYGMLPFSSAGPRDDGGFKPTITGPGASINTIPTWMAGSPVAEAGYDLPPGYGMLQGTSMSSPQVAGASALLLSAAKQRGIDLSAADLRTALTSSADPIRGVQAHEQGAGLMDTGAAWRLISRGATAYEYDVRAPVDHDMSDFLATPGVGAGVYDRESAPAVGERERYEVTITRTSGPDRAVRHTLDLANNHDRTFRITGRSTVSLPLDEPVTVTLEAKPRSSGAHSAILTVDDPRSRGIDHQILATVVVPQELPGPSFAVSEEGEVQRNASDSYFVRVPEGTRSFEVALDGLAEGSQTRWIAITPWGTLADDSTTTMCYPNYDNPANTCDPARRSYLNPTPGVWEIEVESRRTSPRLNNPYTLTATALGATFDPETLELAHVVAGQPTPVGWRVTNELAPLAGSFAAGELGSALEDTPTIGHGAYLTNEVVIGEGVGSFSAVIGSPDDPGADLDLYVYRDGESVGASTSSGSEEAVVIENPEPGTYTVEVHGYSVPQGSTAFAYRDAYLSEGLGTLTVDEEQAVELAAGETASVPGEVTVTAAAAEAGEGRVIFGEVRLLNEAGTLAGSGNLTILHVTP